jgi:MATE family multidrug resistance protein
MMTNAAIFAGARHGLKLELRPLLALAGPVVAAEVGWMTMGLVDTMMVGRVSAEAIGAVGVGGAVAFTVGIFGMGLLLGLDYTVANAIGAQRMDDARRWLVQGLWLALLVALPGTALVWWAMPLLAWAGVRPEVLPQAVLYGRAVGWSLLPLLLMTALRRYLQAVELVRPIMLIVVTANIVNIAANWVFVFGHLGFPALGAEGAGWATCASRLYMAVCLVVCVVQHDRRTGGLLRHVPHAPDWARLRQLTALGVPAAGQLALECGVFAAATTLAAQLEPAALAAHQIALNVAALSFMVPLGVSSAAAVRVGQAVGRRDPDGTTRAGWTALALGGAFMLAAGCVFVAFPEIVLRTFTTDVGVLATGATLLRVAALFQLFDGLQVVGTGVLRGVGDTRTPMIANLVGHWVLGLPVGSALCFFWGWGVVGLWVGLSLGLIAVALVLVQAWSRRVRAVAAQRPLNEMDCLRAAG